MNLSNLQGTILEIIPPELISIIDYYAERNISNELRYKTHDASICTMIHGKCDISRNCDECFNMVAVYADYKTRLRYCESCLDNREIEYLIDDDTRCILCRMDNIDDPTECVICLSNNETFKILHWGIFDGICTIKSLTICKKCFIIPSLKLELNNKITMIADDITSLIAFDKCNESNDDDELSEWHLI